MHSSPLGGSVCPGQRLDRLHTRPLVLDRSCMEASVIDAGSPRVRWPRQRSRRPGCVSGRFVLPRPSGRALRGSDFGREAGSTGRLRCATRERTATRGHRGRSGRPPVPRGPHRPYERAVPDGPFPLGPRGRRSTRPHHPPPAAHRVDDRRSAWRHGGRVPGTSGGACVAGCDGDLPARHVGSRQVARGEDRDDVRAMAGEPTVALYGRTVRSPEPDHSVCRSEHAEKVLNTTQIDADALTMKVREGARVVNSHVFSTSDRPEAPSFRRAHAILLLRMNWTVGV